VNGQYETGMKKHKTMRIYNFFLRSVSSFRWSLENIQLPRTAAHGSPAELIPHLLVHVLILSPTCSHSVSPVSILSGSCCQFLLFCPGVTQSQCSPFLRKAERIGWSKTKLCFSSLQVEPVLVLISHLRTSLRSACSWIDPAPATLAQWA